MKAISIKDLTVQFGRTVVLDNLSLEVENGEVFGIVGRSGAGKTTLINCLTALEKPTTGEVCVAGKAISKAFGSELICARQQMGMIFQQFHLFSSRTAADNIRYPLEISGKKGDVSSLLELVGLQGKGHLYPSELSGGQRQRVAIARALALEPKLLLCDEPTSALDPETTTSILQLLLKLNRELGITIVIITHEMDVVKQICHRTAVLEKGKFIEVGRSIDLFAHPKNNVTKRLLSQMTHDIPPHIKPSGPNCQLLHLCFKSGLAEQGVIDQMVKSLPVSVNILMGSIDVLVEGHIGNLVIELSGEEEDRDKARRYLTDLGVEVEEVAR